jgi:hypothetical protein
MHAVEHVLGIRGDRRGRADEKLLAKLLEVDVHADDGQRANAART